MAQKNGHTDWHSQDEFWELMGPVLFNPARMTRAVEEIDAIVRLLELDRPARVLDLACGPGRHSLELARRGYEVVGVDRTAAFIVDARRAAADEGLPVEFTVGDMRKVLEPESFDVVLNLFGSFGYFEVPADNRAVVQHMVTSLRPGGRFLVETQGKEILARTFQPRDWSEADGMLILAERAVSHNWSRVDTRWIVVRDGERHEYRVAVQLYSAAEMVALFAACGFADVQVYGSLGGVPYDHTAQRLVVVGRR